MSNLLRQYEERECGKDGYPYAWHRGRAVRMNDLPSGDPPYRFGQIVAIKDLIRDQAGHRCLRCGHPYPPGIAETHPRGEWTPCDELCTHDGPLGLIEPGVYKQSLELHGPIIPLAKSMQAGWPTVARARDIAQERDLLTLAHWRILTVHHLDEDKANCRWWNLAALCQRCHLRMQRAVVMDRVYSFEHSEWFKPYAAGFYAHKYLRYELDVREYEALPSSLQDLYATLPYFRRDEDREFTREEVMDLLPEILKLEHRFTQEAIF